MGTGCATCRGGVRVVRLAWLRWRGTPHFVRLHTARVRGIAVGKHPGCGCLQRSYKAVRRLRTSGEPSAVLLAQVIELGALAGSLMLSLGLSLYLMALPPTPRLAALLRRPRPRRRLAQACSPGAAACAAGAKPIAVPALPPVDAMSIARAVASGVRVAEMAGRPNREARRSQPSE